MQFGVQLGYDALPKWFDADEDGRATLEIPAQNPKYCALLSRAAGYVTMRATWQKGVIPDDGLPMEFTFKVPAATTVGGIIIDEKGKPVHGAKVEFTAVTSMSSAVQPVLSPCYKAASTTDKDGQWRCTTAPAEMENAWINVAHPDYFVDRTFSTGHFVTDRLNDLRDLHHTWTLKKGFRVTGRIVNEEGKPVPDASLAICRLNSPSGVPIQKTDAEGRFVFDRVEVATDFDTDDPISLTIAVLKPGYAPNIETILLRRAQIILGKVTDAKTKKPIPKFVVERAFEGVGGYPDGLYWIGQYFDGKEGKYRGSVNMAPTGGRYTYRALADGYEPAVSQSTLFDETEETIDFQLQPKRK